MRARPMGRAILRPNRNANQDNEADQPQSQMRALRHGGFAMHLTCPLFSLSIDVRCSSNGRVALRIKNEREHPIPRTEAPRLVGIVDTHMGYITRSLPMDKDELDLPALDGEDEDETEALPELLDVKDIEGDAFDDATGEDAPVDGSEIHVEGTAEGGWLVDAENAGATLDVGPMDVSIEPEGKVLGDDEADTRGGLDDLVSDDESVTVDGGEEGPLDEDEELREEDLPALDADEDGDVPDDELYDRGIITSDEDLKWDDRAWARLPDAGAAASSGSSAEIEPDDSGVLAVPGDDPTQSVRDTTWKQLDESGRLMAATFVPGGSVVVAVSVPDRSRALIVRIQSDGEARIIAEVDPRRADDDGEACTVTFLRWDAARGCLFVGGNFGVEAYRPAV
jgi:hypothetical protein